MIRFKNIILFLAVLSLQSCLDMFDESPKVFTNKIFLHESTGGQYLIFAENYEKDGIYNFVLGEPVLEAMGNDSIIYVKSNFKEEAHYHTIKHNKGEKILAIKVIDSLSYTRLIGGKNFKFLYFK